VGVPAHRHVVLLDPCTAERAEERGEELELLLVA
jgi:hypothetical protein